MGRDALRPDALQGLRHTVEGKGGTAWSRDPNSKARRLPDRLSRAWEGPDQPFGGACSNARLMATVELGINQLIGAPRFRAPDATA